LRRVFAIAIVAALVLVLSAGTAFASTCAVAPCEAMRAMASPMADLGCTPSVARAHRDTGAPASMSARCDMRPEQRTGDTSSVPRSAPEISSAVVAGVLAPAVLSGSSAVPAPVAADARGAPHLSAVIRI
jgi:hypothetical protein